MVPSQSFRFTRVKKTDEVNNYWAEYFVIEDMNGSYMDHTSRLIPSTDFKIFKDLSRTNLS